VSIYFLVLNFFALCYKMHTPFSIACWNSRIALCLLLLGACLQNSTMASPHPEVLDFDHVSEDLPDWWAAVGFGRSDQFQNQRAKDWSTPVKFQIVMENPHEGAACLLWEFTDDSEVPVFLRPGQDFPGTGSKARVVFAMRAENLTSPAFLSVAEHVGDERIANHHQKAQFDVTDQWEEFTWELDLQPQTDNLRLSFSVEEQLKGVKIWLDNIRVYFTD
jgi:hypothetical protein